MSKTSLLKKAKNIKITNAGLDVTLSSKDSQKRPFASLAITALEEWICGLENGTSVILDTKTVSQLKKQATEILGYWGVRLQNVFYPLKKVEKKSPQPQSKGSRLAPKKRQIKKSPVKSKRKKA